MPSFSGATKQSLASLLDQGATHSIIESLYLRFEVTPLTTFNNPNKLKKATHLVTELSKRTSGNATLMGLINYVGSDSFGQAAFRRGAAESKDFYENLDRDLGSMPAEPEPAPRAERQFARPGTTATQPPTPLPTARRFVFVVRGRDEATYTALVSLLRALDLRVVTWEDAVRGLEGGTPSTLDIVRSGIDMADAVVVLMTPDDLGKVKNEFSDPHDSPTEAKLTGQARQNVVFEAGWAMALKQNKVVLVQAGDVRALSDIDGLNYVRLSGDISSRKTLINRLRNCKLDVDDSGEEWRTAGTFTAQA